MRLIACGIGAALALLSGWCLASVPDVLKPAGGVLQPPAAAASAQLDRLVDYRVCGEPARDADGSIHRSSTVLTAFRKAHPCPATGLTSGACPGWAINHVVPLAKGGCDAVINLDWMPDQIKSCTDPWCRDRWERLYFGAPHGVIAFPAAASAP